MKQLIIFIAGVLMAILGGVPTVCAQAGIAEDAAATQAIDNFDILIAPFQNPAFWLYLVFLVILAYAVIALFKAAPFLSKI